MTDYENDNIASEELSGQTSEFEEEVVDETPEAEGVEAEADAPVDGDDVGDSALPRQVLSPHFNLVEFHSKDGVAVPENTVDGLIKLCVEILEPLRDKFGKCEVNSGFRSKNRNQAVGGATKSYHRYDLRPGFAAADVKFDRGTSREWFDEADRIHGNTGGVGFYPRFVHVDNRTERWRGEGG